MKISIPQAELQQICKKWKITELALFGSALSDDFDPISSDIDLLVTFEPGVTIGWDIVLLKLELEQLFQRPVDIVRKEAIEKSRNPFRKNAILGNQKVIYEQAS